MFPATSIGQRFTQLIQQLGLSKNAFAQSLGKTATVIQHLVEERNKPGFDLLGKVFEIYPNVSRDWLMLGQGPMLLDATTPELFEPAAPVAPPAPVPAAIDLADIPGLPRRRATGAGTLLQPADVAATVALAAAQSAHAPANGAASEPAERLVAPSLAAAPVAPPIVAAPSPPAVPAPASPPPLPAALPDPAYLAALLQAQHLQHQLALAEQRNQHLLEQQALLRQLVEVLQKV